MAQPKTLQILANIDKPLLLVYIAMVFMGWFNIYAAVYSDVHMSIFDLNMQYGKQLIWIIAAMILASTILLIDSKFFSVFTYPIYGLTVFLLLSVLFFGKEVNGARAWFEFGGLRIQPGEFVKIAICLAIAKILSRHSANMKSLKTMMILGGILILPGAIILLQNDTGSMIVYAAFVLVFYREGLPGAVLLFGLSLIVLFVVSLLFPSYYVISGILISLLLLVFFIRRRLMDVVHALIVLSVSSLLALGVSYYFFNMSLFWFIVSAVAISIVPFYYVSYRYRLRFVAIVASLFMIFVSFVYSVEYIYNSVLEPHQRTRISVLLGNESDLKGAEYNVNQSKIAIGSGGFAGKGFLQGTQTKFNFVPEQSTDFIFCTVGEEWGFLGSLVVIGFYMFFLIRIVFVAERQRSQYSKLFGYCIASVFFFHFMINVGMTFGMVPVIGIPLPFFSYGGSSLWTFTILLFIFLKLDLDRDKIIH